jgi:DNA-binding Lrp family transcriptional regulator
MPTAYVLINYDIGTEEKFINKLKRIQGVIEVYEVNGVYDIVVKVNSETRLLKRNYNTTHKNNRYGQVNDDTISNRIEVLQIRSS